MPTQMSNKEPLKTFAFTVLFDVGPTGIQNMKEEGELLTPSLLNAFYESGCKDATFGQRAQVMFADFDRDAPSFPDAVISAIKNLESASPDVKVIRVEPEEFVNAANIADRMGRTRASVSLHVGGERGPGHFPQPRFYLDASHPIWTWSSVAAWYSGYTGESAELASNAVFVAMLNAALDIRHYLPGTVGIQRSAIGELLENTLHDASTGASGRGAHAKATR
jgi:hypothetical protein